MTIEALMLTIIFLIWLIPQAPTMQASDPVAWMMIAGFALTGAIAAIYDMAAVAGVKKFFKEVREE